MSTYDKLNARVAVGSDAIAHSNATYMSRVYRWMTAGILLTAWVSFLVSESPEALSMIIGNRAVFWGLIIGELGLVFFLSAAINRISAMTATLVYLLYAAMSGLTLSVIFLAYTHESIATTFATTACGFAGLSAFGYFSKRDLGPIGAFCTMGLFGLIGFSILSFFIPSMNGSGVQMVASVVGVIVFAGLTAYDTQKIKEMNPALVSGDDSQEAAKGAIYGALTLYLDFINLFLFMLRLMGGGRSRD